MVDGMYGSGSGNLTDTGRIRAGSRVMVRSRAEILATLDRNGRVDGLPFMPEMLAYAGREFTVDAVVHRTCDTIKSTGTSGTTRRMERTVHLEGLRCDGSAHGGCQARCLLYWKLDWLREMSSESSDESNNYPDEFNNDVPAKLIAATRRSDPPDDRTYYSCQATELLAASSFVSARHPRMWVMDVRSGNATFREALKGLLLLTLGKLRNATSRLPIALRVRNLRIWPELHPTSEKREPPPLNLQPGELVEVRSKEEIEAILDSDDSRGPRFDPGMLLDCGTRARVVGRVDQLIDETTGRMLKLRGDCVVLDRVWCDGSRQALCRRKLYTFWREAWLRRVDEVDRSVRQDEPPAR